MYTDSFIVFSKSVAKDSRLTPLAALSEPANLRKEATDIDRAADLWVAMPVTATEMPSLRGTGDALRFSGMLTPSRDGPLRGHRCSQGTLPGAQRVSSTFLPQFCCCMHTPSQRLRKESTRYKVNDNKLAPSV